MKPILLISLLFLVGVGGFAQNHLFFDKEVTIEFKQGRTHFTVPDDKLWFFDATSMKKDEGSVLVGIDQGNIITLQNGSPNMVAFKSVEVYNYNPREGKFRVTQYSMKMVDYPLIDSE